MGKGILGALAVVGSVAAFALFNSNSTEGTNFLQASPVETAFQQYMAKFGRNFGTKAEYYHRLEIFTKNYYKVMNHNSFGVEEHGFTAALTQFSDLSEEEFR